MTIKPWREVARPHRDVLGGTFKQSEFAADITQVTMSKTTSHYYGYPHPGEIISHAVRSYHRLTLSLRNVPHFNTGRSKDRCPSV